MPTTQLEHARKGILTDEMKIVAESEQVDPEDLRKGIADGKIIILSNLRHESAPPVAIGAGMRTKVNANIGSSRDHADPEVEEEKARTAVSAGADTLMDLSTGGDIDAIRKGVMEAAPIAIGTVPFYQAAIETVKKEKSMVEMDPEDLFGVIEKHVREVRNGLDQLLKFVFTDAPWVFRIRLDLLQGQCLYHRSLLRRWFAILLGC